MKAIDKIHEISKKLAPSGIEAAEKEAELFIREGLQINLVDLYRDNPELSDEQAVAIEEMVSRRSKREPLQYILGYCDFLGLKLLMGKGVLIPRPETELMAEQAIKAVSGQRSAISEKNTEKKFGSAEARKRVSEKDQRMTVLDLCTGSGCLALALAREFENSQVYGTDISETAIKYARKNATVNEIKNATFFCGQLFEPLYTSKKLFDFIISNPPYIRTDDIKDLQQEIRDWEPLNALDGGPDGSNFYREIIPIARKFLKDNGILMVEIGAGCTNDVANMFNHAGYSQIEVLKDYAGIERIISAKWIR